MVCTVLSPQEVYWVAQVKSSLNLINNAPEHLSAKPQECGLSLTMYDLF